MTEITRALASVQAIKNIRVHPNADSLEIAEVKGWDIIVRKGLHQIGEWVLYLEIDSFIPVMSQFEFLRKACFRTTSNLGDGFRLKTIKLRGELSQGLVMPLADFNIPFDIEVGTDLTAFLGVQKYEKPLPSNLTGRVRGNFPLFIPKTDQERIQNIGGKERTKYGDDTFEVTVKLDGSSMTVYANEGTFGVCSRNWDLEEEEGNTYWKVFRDANMHIISMFFGYRNLALQGELVGPGVNHNRGGLTEHEFYLFDIYDIDARRYLTPAERHYMFSYLVELGMKIKQVPMYTYYFPFPSNETALGMADTAMFNGRPGEGLVYKSNTNEFSFKAISNKYLLANDE